MYTVHKPLRYATVCRDDRQTAVGGSLEWGNSKRLSTPSRENKDVVGVVSVGIDQLLSAEGPAEVDLIAEPCDQRAQQSRVRDRTVEIEREGGKPFHAQLCTDVGKQVASLM